MELILYDSSTSPMKSQFPDKFKLTEMRIIHDLEFNNDLPQNFGIVRLTCNDENTREHVISLKGFSEKGWMAPLDIIIDSSHVMKIELVDPYNRPHWSWRKKNLKIILCIEKA